MTPWFLSRMEVSILNKKYIILLVSIILMTILSAFSVFLKDYYSARSVIYEQIRNDFLEVDNNDHNLLVILQKYKDTKDEDYLYVMLELAHTTRYTTTTLSNTPLFIAGKGPSAEQVGPYRGLREDIINTLQNKSEFNTDYYIEFLEKKLQYNTYFAYVIGLELPQTKNSNIAIEQMNIVSKNIDSKYLSFNKAQDDFLREKLEELGLYKYYGKPNIFY